MRMAGQLPVSLVVITRDAAADIQECLLSAQICADALVVDSGSGDHTVEAARRCGARVVSRAWLGFGPQKQFAVQEARYDWVLCLDADERLSPKLRESIGALFENGEPPHPAYALARRNRFLGRWLSHGEGYPDWVTRLFDRRRASAYAGCGGAPFANSAPIDSRSFGDSRSSASRHSTQSCRASCTANCFCGPNPAHVCVTTRAPQRRAVSTV